MSIAPNRRTVLRAALAAGLTPLLQPARACEFFAAHLRVYHPWTRETDFLDTSAVVCMTFDEVSRSDRLVGVESPVAEGAELCGPGLGPLVNLPIPLGQVVTLQEAGTFIRLTGLKEPLGVGRSYPLTLIFEQSGPLLTNLSVDYTRL
jgi:copper(I)-binding protein